MSVLRNLLCWLAIIAVTSADRSVLFVKHAEGAAEQLQQELSSRSDPSSMHYLNWMTQLQVQSILAPHPDQLATALQLAQRHGAHTTVLHDKIIADFVGTVPTDFIANLTTSGAIDFASSLGNQKQFEMASSRPPLAQRQATACNQYDTIAKCAADTACAWSHWGCVNKKLSVAPANISSGPQACLGAMLGVTPTCLREAYGLTGSASAHVGGGQAFVVNEGFLPSDLAKFQTEYKLDSDPVGTIIGHNPKVGGEASLDSQYITTTGQGVATTYVYLDGSMENPFTNWLVWAGNASDDQLPKVHSLSLGAPETSVGDGIMKRMNTEMAALGVRGVSIVFASGDSGYQPVQKFGAASPYVTAVGGVYNGELRDEELQADALTTGGFAASQLNKAGDWQKAAIASFMKTSGQRPAHIDTTQRAVPDLSAYDDEIAIVKSGEDTTLAGTSAAAPMVAGMLASINDALLAAGHKTTLGFVNPLLYANEDAFLDITKGGNRGINAVKGYDPVSGLGTFSPTTFTKLKAAALKASARAMMLRQEKN